MTERTTVEQLYTGTRPLSSAKVGDQLGAREFVVTADMVARNAWANDDYHPWYMDGSPFGGQIISPVFLASFDAQVFYSFYAYPSGGSLFAKQEFHYRKPVFVGQPYTMHGELIEIYERKGRTFYRAQIRVLDRDGDEAMRMIKTIAAPVHPNP
jgi:acyl dehydratase